MLKAACPWEQAKSVSSVWVLEPGWGLIRWGPNSKKKQWNRNSTKQDFILNPRKNILADADGSHALKRV